MYSVLKELHLIWVSGVILLLYAVCTASSVILAI